jgi:hypothetical protein
VYDQMMPILKGPAGAASAGLGTIPIETSAAPDV